MACYKQLNREAKEKIIRSTERDCTVSTGTLTRAEKEHRQDSCDDIDDDEWVTALWI